MTESKEEEIKRTQYTPPKVNRFYRYDWQYAVDISKKTSLAVISLILFVVPLVLEAKIVVPLNLWFLWTSAVAYIISLLIITFRCPIFIKDYRDFGKYKERNHSHRFVVWEFYFNLNSLKRWKEVVEETRQKKLSIDENSPTYSQELNLLTTFKSENIAENEVTVKYPVNIDRDIFLPIGLYGKKIILSMKENDPQLNEKEKELFWILYSQAAKERIVWRVIFWIFIYISIIASFLAILNNIRKAVAAM